MDVVRENVLQAQRLCSLLIWDRDDNICILEAIGLTTEFDCQNMQQIGQTGTYRQYLEAMLETEGATKIGIGLTGRLSTPHMTVSKSSACFLNSVSYSFPFLLKSSISVSHNRSLR